MVHLRIYWLNINLLLKKYEKQQKDFELKTFAKHALENTGDISELNMLKNTLKSGENRNLVLMKENLKLKDEVGKLTEDLSKFTKGKENLDKLLGKQKLLMGKISLSFGETSCKIVQEGKVNTNKTQVSIQNWVYWQSLEKYFANWKTFRNETQNFQIMVFKMEKREKFARVVKPHFDHRRVSKNFQKGFHRKWFSKPGF